MNPSRVWSFTATCERCGAAVPLTKAEERARIHADGSFTCDRCKERPVRIRVISARPSGRR